jgi:hypothetical protein
MAAASLTSGARSGSSQHFTATQRLRIRRNCSLAEQRPLHQGSAVSFGLMVDLRAQGGWSVPRSWPKAVALQTPVDARARGDILPGLGELVLDATGSPPWVRSPQLADERLHLGGDLMGTRRRTMGPIRKGSQAACFVPGDPAVHALAGDAEAPSDLDDSPTILDHGEHRLVPLFHDAELHQHGYLLLNEHHKGEGRTGHCQASPGATVNHQPDPVSKNNRSGVKPQVTPERPASPGTRHFLGGAGRTRTSGRRIMSLISGAFVTCGNRRKDTTTCGFECSVLPGVSHPFAVRRGANTGPPRTVAPPDLGRLRPSHPFTRSGYDSASVVSTHPGGAPKAGLH